MADYIEKEAPSVSEAVFAAAISLGISEKEAQVQILAQAKGGRAKVRVGRPGVVMPEVSDQPDAMAETGAAEKTSHSKPAGYAPRQSKERPTDEEAEKVRDQLAGLLEKMGTPSEIEIKERLDNKILNIKGEFEGLLIGKKGMTLDALQEVSKRFLDPEGRSNKHIVVDVADYRGKHEEGLLAYAADLATQAANGDQITSKPLNPSDRRVVHMTLKETGNMDTWSVGDGAMKKVVVQKKNA